MKNALLSVSLLASATTFAASAVAAERINQPAVAPTPASVNAVTSFIDRYAGSAAHARPAAALGDMGGSATDLVLYPTADRNVVFVTFHADGASRAGDHVALVTTRSGKVTRFTDFTGPAPRALRTLTAGTGDAQAQARALLVAATPASSTTAVSRSTAPVARISAQSQAADLLRAVPATTPVAAPRVLVARGTPVVHGDSQAMARAVLTASAGE